MTGYRDWETDRKSTRLNSSHRSLSRMPSSAKANDMRAAGLNALLGDVSASGNIGSGAAATAAESAQMMPTDYSFIGDAANRGLAAYNTTRSIDASVSLQKSQENVNKSIEGVNMAQRVLWSPKQICRK